MLRTGSRVKGTQRVGSRAQVMHGNAKMTGGGLKKRDLKYNKQGKIVSKKMSQRAKKEKRLQKAGYTTIKGQFGAVRSMKGGAGFGFDTPEQQTRPENQLYGIANNTSETRDAGSKLIYDNQFVNNKYSELERGQNGVNPNNIIYYNDKYILKVGKKEGDRNIRNEIKGYIYLNSKLISNPNNANDKYLSLDNGNGSTLKIYIPKLIKFGIIDKTEYMYIQITKLKIEDYEMVDMGESKRIAEILENKIHFRHGDLHKNLYKKDGHYYMFDFEVCELLGGETVNINSKESLKYDISSANNAESELQSPLGKRRINNMSPNTSPNTSQVKSNTPSPLNRPNIYQGEPSTPPPPIGNSTSSVTQKQVKKTLVSMFGGNKKRNSRRKKK
jgi:hypothetical protein